MSRKTSLPTLPILSILFSPRPLQVVHPDARARLRVLRRLLLPWNTSSGRLLSGNSIVPGLTSIEQEGDEGDEGNSCNGTDDNTSDSTSGETATTATAAAAGRRALR